MCGKFQYNWVKEAPIEFFTDGMPGIRLTDALRSDFSSLDGRDDRMLQYSDIGDSISIRIQVCRSDGRFWLRSPNSSIP